MIIASIVEFLSLCCTLFLARCEYIYIELPRDLPIVLYVGAIFSFFSRRLEKKTGTSFPFFSNLAFIVQYREPVHPTK